MDPGAYISITQIAFVSACAAIRTFKKGLNYGKDAERLILGLEIERYRLQVWGENSGLVPPDGEVATVPDRLLPIFPTLKRHLDAIVQLVENAGDLQNRYGLAPTEDPPTTSERMRSLVERMHRSIRAVGIAVQRVDASTGDADNEADDMPPDNIGTKGKRRTNTLNRIRWAIRDLDKFDGLVTKMAQMITKLNDLLTETQQRKANEDNRRINMIVVGSAVDQESLELILAAVRSEPDTSELRAGIERKALSPDLAGQRPLRAMAFAPPSLSEFQLPESFRDMRRFVAMKRLSAGTPYLLERKDFDRNISPDDKKKLTDRIQRLVMLLRKPKSPGFMTPEAEGCIHDPASSCWWMVLRFPLDPQLGAQPLAAPVPLVSLLSLLQSKNRPRPPLELRVSLGSALCTTFSELYSSGWLHKGVRSENILFRTSVAPTSAYTTAQIRTLLSSFLVAGFEYSRHETEWATIDKARNSGDVGVAMYRHPDYQGEAAEGYKMQHDIYSLGLVLVEIALWVPIASFLQGIPAGGGSKANEDKSTVELSAGMKLFHAPHAAELKRRVTSRVDTELAFRVGSPYYHVVKYCLGAGDILEETDGSEIPAHPALDFYDNAVIPLAKASRSEL